MSEQDFQDQLSGDTADELHPEDIDPEAVSDETDEPEVDDDRVVPDDGDEPEV
jgi:hypothetical protein